MELTAIKNYHVISRHSLVSDFPSRGLSNFYCSFFCPKTVSGSKKWVRNSISHPRVARRIESEFRSLNELANKGGKLETVNSGFIEVIAIGGRKDALVEFCLDSPFNSSSLRFWNIAVNDESNVQLQQRFIGTDLKQNVVKAAEFIGSCPKAVILGCFLLLLFCLFQIAGSGYGSDHIFAIDILRKLRLANGFAVAITLKPFKFEGQRRADEINNLVGGLQGCTSFCIDIDGNMLLNRELVTLDEALQIVNSAVVLAINMISVLFCEKHRKLIEVPHSNIRELKASEIVNILERLKEAKVGFGGGLNIKSSVSQAIYDCPFIDAEDLDGLFICGIASSEVVNDSDVQAFWRDFRQTAGHVREIITFLIHEPSLEWDMIVTTVIVFGSRKQAPSEKSSSQDQPSERKNLFSKLAQHFAFFSNFVKGNQSQAFISNGTVLLDALPSMVKNKIDSTETVSSTDREVVVEEFRDDSNSSRLQDRGSKEKKMAHWDGKQESDYHYDEFMDEIGRPGSPLQREALSGWNTGPGHHMAEKWPKERASDSGATPSLDNIGIYCLPVGIRPSDELEEGGITPCANECSGPTFGDGETKMLFSSSMSSLGTMTDAGFGVVREVHNSASTMLERNASISKKQRVLSARAASMLESERDSPKKWTPLVEMQYRGGVYQGRCQGGLPEGKGRLVLEDGSIYDGTWRYGKRSGLGTFYFSNGDVFQGSWREDLIHGKGWFYFHTGDRWFANFWKGKASGEGRFYSNSGDIFFGHFEDGWRHGQFLCINVDGTRWIEIWNEGVLVSRKQLDTAE